MAEKADDGANTVRRGSLLIAEDPTLDRMLEVNERPDLVATAEDAMYANAAEHRMTLWEALKTYPKAIGWSLAFSTAVVMEGYDTNLLASFYGLPQFNQKYGTRDAAGNYQLSAAWQSGLSQGATVGEILGLFLNGWLSDRFGYRRMMMVSLCCVIGFIFILFFAPNVQTLEVGELLCGIPWGVFQTLTTTYAADVCPTALRAYLTTYVNLCWVFGQLISSGVLRSMLNRHDQWAYRVPFSIQWIWPVPILIAVIFAPESPYYLIRKGKLKEAEHSIRRLASASENVDPAKTVAQMIHTNEIEKATTAGYTYWDCFKGVNLRRTEIACVVWAIQNICGSSFMGYSTYFYEQAGLSSTYSYDFSMIQYALGAIGTFLSWFAMMHIGRRTLYTGGLAILTTLLFIIGFLSLAPKSEPGPKWATGSMLLIYTFFYDFTVGPVCYSLVSEIPSTRLRIKTVVLARNVYNLNGIWAGVITAYMLNPTAFDWAGKAGFFWGGWCLVSCIYCYFRLPEPRGRTYEELDLLFEQHTPARKFKKTEVDPFRRPSFAVLNDKENAKGNAENIEKAS